MKKIQYKNLKTYYKPRIIIKLRKFMKNQNRTLNKAK
jgi:hypothetical protein